MFNSAFSCDFSSFDDLHGSQVSCRRCSDILRNMRQVQTSSVKSGNSSFSKLTGWSVFTIDVQILDLQRWIVNWPNWARAYYRIKYTLELIQVTMQASRDLPIQEVCTAWLVLMHDKITRSQLLRVQPRQLLGSIDWRKPLGHYTAHALLYKATVHMRLEFSFFKSGA